LNEIHFRVRIYILKTSCRVFCAKAVRIARKKGCRTTENLSLPFAGAARGGARLIRRRLTKYPPPTKR